MTTIDEAVAAWKTANPPPLQIEVNQQIHTLTPAEYDAKALDSAQDRLDWEARRLAGQTEIEALGLTVAQVRAVYTQLKAGTASATNAQKAIAGIMRHVWRDLVNDD